MKKLLKILGITIALTAIGVGVRAIKEKNKYRLEGKQLRKEINDSQKEYYPYTKPWWEQKTKGS